MLRRNPAPLRMKDLISQLQAIEGPDEEFAPIESDASDDVRPPLVVEPCSSSALVRSARKRATPTPRKVRPFSTKKFTPSGLLFSSEKHRSATKAARMPTSARSLNLQPAESPPKHVHDYSNRSKLSASTPQSVSNVSSNSILREYREREGRTPAPSTDPFQRFPIVGDRSHAQPKRSRAPLFPVPGPVERRPAVVAPLEYADKENTDPSVRTVKDLLNTSFQGSEPPTDGSKASQTNDENNYYPPQVESTRKEDTERSVGHGKFEEYKYCPPQVESTKKEDTERSVGYKKSANPTDEYKYCPPQVSQAAESRKEDTEKSLGNVHNGKLAYPNDGRSYKCAESSERPNSVSFNGNNYNLPKEPVPVPKETPRKIEGAEINSSCNRPGFKPNANVMPNLKPPPPDIIANPIESQNKSTNSPKHFGGIVIKNKQYAVLGKLGSGGSCDVYKVVDPQTSTLYAVKCVNMAVDSATAESYMNEIKLLQRLQGSDRVITMYDFQYVKEQKKLYVLLEMGDVDLSNLLKFYRAKEKFLPYPILVGYWTEMLTAVNHIHKNGIIHSDLKPANFLLVHGRLKLIDFGIASSLNADATSVMKNSTAGTFNYISPEAITMSTANDIAKISYRSDVWSLGCILYSMLYGHTPFSHVKHLYAKIAALSNPNQRIEYPPLKDVPPVLMKALRWCLTFDVKKRPTVQELIELPYLNVSDELPPSLVRKIKDALTEEEWRLAMKAMGIK